MLFLEGVFLDRKKAQRRANDLNKPLHGNPHIVRDIPVKE